MTDTEQIKQIEDVAALDFDLFTRIAHGVNSAVALAKAIGIPENRLVTLLTALKNPNAVCLTPDYIEGALKQAGFTVEGTEVMLTGITMLTRALKPM